MHKNRRIRNGFIFHVRFGEGALYLRRSVEMFRKLGDGRFPLAASATTMLGDEAGYTGGRLPETDDSVLYERGKEFITRWSLGEYAETVSPVGSDYDA